MTTARQTLDLQRVRISLLSDPSILAQFECGELEIDRHVKDCCAWHDIHRARVFVAADGSPVAAGFYCLSISASDAKNFNAEVQRAAGSRAFIPFIYLNYLAVRSDIQNQGLGKLLLIHALRRCEEIAQRVGFYGVSLHALTTRAADLYHKYGFRAHDERMAKPFMILPTRALLELFAEQAAP